LPHRATRTNALVRVTVAPAKPQLANVGVHVPDNRVAVNGLFFGAPCPMLLASNQVFSQFTPNAHGANCYMFDCRRNTSSVITKHWALVAIQIQSLVY